MSVPIRATTFVLIAALVLAQFSNTPRISAQEIPANYRENFLQVRVTASANGAVIEWSIGSEPVLGFNVYRIQNGQRAQLNPSLIAGSVLTDRTRSQSYSWLDRAGTRACRYYVEAIDLRGEATTGGLADPQWSTALPRLEKSPCRIGSVSTIAVTTPGALLSRVA